MGLLNTVQHFQYGITYVYAMDVYRTSMGLHNNVIWSNLLFIYQL